MSEHISVERMHESLDGVLSSSEISRLEAHLMECEPCRNEYARLSEVVSAVRALPRAAFVPEGAWAGIEQRVGQLEREGSSAGADEREATILPLRAGITEKRSVTGTLSESMVSLSMRQLAAAAALVAVLSGTAVWVALDGPGGPASMAESSTEQSLGGAAARAVSLESDRYSEVVDQLEQILTDGRAILSVETLVTIEESLLTVDAAIEEIETALADDPNSDLLLRMLGNHQRTKLGVLQRAAAAVQALT